MKLYCNLYKKNIIITESQSRLIKEQGHKSDFDLHLLFEAELKDIYTKYYNNIPENDFWQIVKADPTYNPQREQKMGKYGKWMLNLKKKNLLKIEDLYKFTESLEVFDKVKNQLEKKDINQYQNGIDLYNAVKDYINGEKTSMSKSEQIRMLKNEQATKAYEDEKWVVIMPKTEEAAKYYGKGTRWCTAAENNNMFNTYYKDGPIYILIDKENGQKYQFQLETDQFKDELDSEIMGIIPDELGFTEGLLKFFNSLGGRWVEVMQEDRVGDNYVLYNQNGWIVFVNADNVMTIRDNNTHTEWFIETRDLMVVTQGERPKYVYHTPLYKIWPAEVIDAVVEYDAFDENLIYGYICGIKCDGSGSVHHLTSTNGQNFLYVDNDYEEQRILFAFNSQTYEVKQIINFYYDYDDVEFDGIGTDIRYLKLEYGEEVSYYDLDTLQFVEEYIEVESAFVGKDSYSYIANDENYITFCMDNHHLAIPIPQIIHIYEILRVNKINFPYFLIDIHCSSGDFIYDVSNKKYINNSPIIDYKFTGHGIVLLPAEIDMQYKKYWSDQFQKFSSYINKIDHNEWSKYASAFKIFQSSGIASLFNINLLDNNVIFISNNGEIGTLTDFLNLQVTPKYTDLLIKMWQKITNFINKSEPIGENKNAKLPNLINETVRDILFEHILTEATLDDIYTKYYSNIPQEDFWQIVKSDPTYNPQREQKMGKYGKWLLNLYRQGRLKLEDLYKATDYLSYFSKYINKIEQKDINKYDSLPALLNVVQPFKDAQESGNEMATSKSDEIRKIKEDAEKFYEDDTWLVVIPHSQEAACYYGKNTEWCTAAESSYNMFNEYYDDGLLYININKKTNKKYQFHFESSQFMDEHDDPISVPIVSNIPLTQGLIKKYIEKYGGRATIALTKPFDYNLSCEEIIIGDEPYYSYIDYDGYTPIVKTEGLKVVNICPDELDLSNKVEYIGNGIFKYKITEISEVYGNYEDEVYEEENEMTVIFDAKTKQTMKGNFNHVFPINQNYMQLTDNSVYTTKIIDTNTFEIVGSTYPQSTIRTPEEHFRYVHRTAPFAEYDPNIVVITKQLEGKEIEIEGYGHDTINRVYDLKKGRYIKPQIFANDPYGYKLNTFQLKDGKYYMIYQGYINNNGYDATPAYVIVNTDGSLSEVLTESKNTKLKNIINETVRDILFEHILTEATLDDIYTKYYSNIPQEDFWNIIKTDPTWNEQSPQKMGKYGKWLLNQYKQGKLKLEDLYKYRESLEAFHKYNRQLEKRDINAYGDGNVLYDAVKQFIDDPEQATSKSDEIRRIKQDVEKVYEDNEWLILIPKTEEAAKYYGKGTRWCTAADNNNYFNYYNQDGPLYINIRKSDGDKFQFHFESEQFMDSSDTPLTGVIADEIGLSKGASEYYASLGKNQNYEINEHDHDDPDAEPEEETIYENEAGWKITAYPDSENCYVIAPDGAFYYVEYSYGIEDPDGRPLTGVLSDYFPADIIEYIEDYLRNDYFYGLLLNIEPDDIKDVKQTKFVDYEKEIEYVDSIVVTLKNQNTLLYSINATDRRGQLIKDFGQDGYIYDDNLTEKLSGRYTDFRFLVVKNMNSNKYNVFKQGNYVFEQDVDKISFAPNENPSGIIGSNALITNGTPNSNMIIPPFQKGLHVAECNYDGKSDLAIICHNINRENNSISQLSIYSISKHQYLTSRLYDSITILSQGDYSYKNHVNLGYLMLDKGMPHIWISDLIGVKGKDYYDEIEKMRNILNFSTLYNPDIENEVVLKNGNTTTLKDIYINLGIYDKLKEIWVNNQNLIRK